MSGYPIALPRARRRRRRLPRPPRFTRLQKLALAWDIAVIAVIVGTALGLGLRPWMPLTGSGVGLDIAAIVAAARSCSGRLADLRYWPWAMSCYLAGLAVAVAL